MYGSNKSVLNWGKRGFEKKMRKPPSTSIGTQTNPLYHLDVLKFILCSENLVINDDTKNIYGLVLNYMNSFHHILNEKFNNSSMGSSICNTFQIPDISNYSLLYDIIHSATESGANRSEKGRLQVTVGNTKKRRFTNQEKNAIM